MSNLFCTLAVGAPYRDLASFLCADFAVYRQPVLVATDEPAAFRRFSNVVVIEHRPARFSYHDKKVALRAALERATTAIFVDADTCIHFWADRRLVRQALSFRFSPGLHASRLFPAGMWEYPEVEAFATKKGMSFDRNVITYWEGLFALSRHQNIGRFFALWDEFHAEHERAGHNGAGEGTCFGIAAEASGLPRQYGNEMLASNLPFVFWPTRLRFERRRLHHAWFLAKEAARGNLNLRMHA